VAGNLQRQDLPRVKGAPCSRGGRTRCHNHRIHDWEQRHTGCIVVKHYRKTGVDHLHRAAGAAGCLRVAIAIVNPAADPGEHL